MPEKIRSRGEREDPGPGGPGDALVDDAGLGLVTVEHGVFAESLPVGGMTVGEVRGRYRDRFDIDPDSTALVDGRPVGEDAVVRDGQMLSFVRHSGEKGRQLTLLKAPKKAGSVAIEIVRDRVRVTTPEGRLWSLSLEETLRRLGACGSEAGSVVVPDGFKMSFPMETATVWVHQTPPKVHNLKWIAEDSPAPYGREARYRNVAVALPYVIVFAAFAKDGAGRLQLTHSNECFFRNEPLKRPDDGLLYPALLNCSKFEDPEGKPLSWICTQFLDPSEWAAVEDDNERLRGSFQALTRCLLETGFNESSDRHEGASWYTASRGVDRRISTMDAWEEATRSDPSFATTVDWLPVGRSVRQVAHRILEMVSQDRPRARSAMDVARVVLKNGRATAADAREEGAA